MRSRIVIRGLTVGLVAGLTLAGMASAEPAAGDGADRCRDEIAALCPDTERRSAERALCLRDRASELSPECRERVARRRSRLTAGVEALRSSCGAEIDEHCDEVRRGSGRLLRCLRKLEPERRSESCESYLDVLARARAQRKRAAEE